MDSNFFLPALSTVTNSLILPEQTENKTYKMLIV